MGDGYKVEPEDLATHAGTVDKLSERLRKAADKGTGVELGVDTYGIIGQFFSGGAREEIAAAGESMRDYAAGLTSLSKAVKTCAEAYERMEEASAKDYEAKARGLR
ncbi:type VII secretion target [Haloechinothrix salitolerans]|uniref:Type VII secretion target n=1 Tax=Haloechinothrix salitolerans TaxID=926830 RepID=A0ABW2BXS0_9PSEU